MKADRSITTSNSLADLAARINAEHEAATAFLKGGLERAINAGNLLIEAKAKLNHHGQWLPWLKANCTVSARTAQAYMRVARSFGKLDDAKSATVADLSFRDALNSLAEAGSVIKDLPAESFERALQSVADHDDAESWKRAVRRVRIEDMRARNRGFLDTPRSMLPPPSGRKVRVARNAALRQWKLAIGPSITRAALIEKEHAARASAAVVELEQERSGLLDRAAALEAEAAALRTDAGEVGNLIAAEIKEAVGPVAPFTETYDFACDVETDAELAALPQRELVDRLSAARGTVSDGLEEIDRGYWGDMMHISPQLITPGPNGPRGSGWTRVGSPEWLDSLFPDWNAPDDDPADQAPPPPAPIAEAGE